MMPLYLQLLKTVFSYRRLIRPELSGLGLSQGQPKVLYFLSLYEGCTQRELANHCDIEPATICRLLDRMEEDGLLIRKAQEGSKRSAAVWLTQPGRELQKRQQELLRRTEREAFQGLTQEEKAQFLSLLGLVYQNLSGSALEDVAE